MKLYYFFLAFAALIIVRILYLSGLLISTFIITKIFMIYGKRDKKNNADLKTEIEVYKRYLFPVKNIMEGLMLYSGSIVGKMYSQRVRLFLYKYIFKMKVEKRVVIYNNLQVRRAHNIKIGEGTIIGDQCILDGRNGLEIGSNVNISTGVWIWTLQHNPQSSVFGYKGERVKIGDRVWISSRVTILPGVTIGEGSVIAANAVVTKDVEPFAIYGGIPAKKITERNKDLQYEFGGDFLPFF